MDEPTQYRFQVVANRTLRILVAEDCDLMRRGLRSLLELHPGWNVCAEARTGQQAVAQAEELRPDIAILDTTLPELNGVEAAKRIRKTCPYTEIMLLSAHDSDRLVREIVEAGVRGYVAKSDCERDLVIAVEALSNHKPWVTGYATELLLSKGRNDGPDDEPDRLTSREREIVQLLAEGKTNKEIASALAISIKTVDSHRANIMRKLGFHSVSELVRYAIRNEMIEP